MSGPASPGRHVVRLAGVIIGYSELEESVPEEGMASGAFRPGIGYDLVEPVFRLFREAVPERGGQVTDEEKLARYHSSRDALALTLEDVDGLVVRTSAIHVADYATPADVEARRLEVLTTDKNYWRRRAERLSQGRE